jgi:hypothetical protein
MSDKPKSTGAGKGDKYRPVNLKKFGENYDEIFRKKRIKKVDNDPCM